MRLFDFVILFTLFVCLGFGLALLWFNLPSSSINYDQFSANISADALSKEHQFYSNMRYRDRIIKYSVEDECSSKKANDVEKAFGILSEKTILVFIRDDSSPEIRILCSKLSPKPEQEGYFVAGEGGPTEIINTSVYSVILSGEVSLYRAESCDEPKIALHEILHSLGFDHNNNRHSIMYPVTDCDQELDDYIIEDINEIYTKDSLPDILIESVSANKTGIYLSFDISVANYGLKNGDNVKLKLLVDDEEIREFEIGDLKIGTRNFLSVQNVRLFKDPELIVFVVTSDDPAELSTRNNRAELKIA